MAFKGPPLAPDEALMYGWCLAGSACLLKARHGAWEVFREQDTRSTVTGSIWRPHADESETSLSSALLRKE